MTIISEGNKALHRNLEIDEVQEAINLTPEQEKCVKSLVRAIKKCEKAGVEFYTVLETISFLNGNNIETIGDEGNFSRFEEKPSCQELGTELDMESHFNMGFSGWADDQHYVFLKKSKILDILNEREHE